MNAFKMLLPFIPTVTTEVDNVGFLWEGTGQPETALMWVEA
jgi:hypothetical protein